MTDSFKHTLIWLLTGTTAVFIAMNWATASFTGTEYLPAGNDSFYHARRILDTVRDPSAFYEFDPRMHVPEGSWVVWPWLYDYAMAQLVRGVMWVTGAEDPMPILVYIPVFWVFVTVGLVLGIAAALRLSWPVRILVGLTAALLPVNQVLHGVGQIDHHYAEYTFVLLALLTGLRWMDDLDRVPDAVLAGFVLGIASGFHNGLFILQLPLLAALFVCWSRGVRLPSRPALAFGVALLAGTLLVLLPSQPFLEGRFEFYLLSWFHLYVALGTAVLAFVFARTPRSGAGLARIAAAGLVLALPLAGQILVAGDFLSTDADIARLGTILEARSLPRILREDHDGFLWLTSIYGGFVLLVPVVLAVAAWRLARTRDPGRIYFHLAVLGGVSLLVLQFRLHYFGTFALYLVPAMGLEALLRARERRRVPLLLLAAVLTASLLYPGIRYRLFATYQSGLDAQYQVIRSLMPSLAERCAQDPGVALTYNDAGHYVRFHTECSVIANNFLLTDLHSRKILEIDRLFRMPADRIIAERPDIEYMLLYFPTLTWRNPEGRVEVLRAEQLREANREVPLMVELLLAERPELAHPELEVLSQVKFRHDDGSEVVLGRLFEIRRGAPAADAAP